MKALLCLEFGLPETLQIKELPVPVMADDEVLIEIKACGINFPDALIIQNKYQFKPPLPFAPGGEVSGIVVETGAKVTHLKKGNRVLALCGWGGMAEIIAVKANKVFPMYPGMDFITAAATLYNYGTSYHALKDRAHIEPGETLLVLGAAGGVGLAAVELGKLMGATVIAAASTEEKLILCKEKGADFTIQYEQESLRDRIKEITQGKGVDVVYDAVGGKWAEQALRSIAWKGRYLVVGFAAGEIPQIPFNLPLLKGCSVMGVFWGSFAEKETAQSMQNLGELVSWLKAGKIKASIHKIYPLEEGGKAIRDLMDRKVKGKAIVKIGDWQEEKNEAVKLAPIPNKDSIKTSHEQLPLVIEDKTLIKNYIGKSIGTSDWLIVTQEMIQDFANATLDYQWVHIDEEKAKALLPSGKTIAHGYLSLSLASQFLYKLISIRNIHSMINYGINKARFISPVPVGSSIRLKVSINSVEEQPNGAVKIFLNCEMELEGSEKPAFVAELISLIF